MPDRTFTEEGVTFHSQKTGECQWHIKAETAIPNAIYSAARITLNPAGKYGSVAKIYATDDGEAWKLYGDYTFRDVASLENAKRARDIAAQCLLLTVPPSHEAACSALKEQLS